jgi:predicted NUDIX family NTP pyrophosphohydrolase
VKETSGTLLYRKTAQGWEVLLVHPSGNYNRRAPWGIPKGMPEPDESLEVTARRETLEETGVTAGQLVPLGHADYTKTRKRIHCFAGPAPADCRPFCASWEVDRAEFLPVDEARRCIHPDQSVFLDRLMEKVAEAAE